MGRNIADSHGWGVEAECLAWGNSNPQGLLLIPRGGGGEILNPQIEYFCGNITTGKAIVHSLTLA